MNNITITLKYLSYGTRVMRGGSFRVNAKRYKEDPVKAAAYTANEWIKDIKREMNVEEILEVIFDGNKNITDEVKQMQKDSLDVI